MALENRFRVLALSSLCVALAAVSLPAWGEPPADAVSVDTGPIWNDGDARLKCPGVCGTRKWNGQWRTTKFQKASQCDCVGAPPAAPPPKAAGPRDCGTGMDDPGCNTAKNKVLPMLVDRYKPGLKALTSEDNELVRQQMLGDIIGKSTLTARQFKSFLKLFDNELVRMDVARTYAPVVVDPDHALDHAATFKNGLLKKDYVGLFKAGGDAPEE